MSKSTNQVRKCPHCHNPLYGKSGAFEAHVKRCRGKSVAKVKGTTQRNLRGRLTTNDIAIRAKEAGRIALDEKHRYQRELRDLAGALDEDEELIEAFEDALTHYNVDLPLDVLVDILRHAASLL